MFKISLNFNNKKILPETDHKIDYIYLQYANIITKPSIFEKYGF